MKKISLWVAALFLGLLGSVHAVDYTFQGTTYPALWDTAGNWNPSLIPPGTTGDSYTITTPTSTDNFIYLPNPANIRYFGSITMTNGSLKYNGSSMNTDTFRFMSDNLQSGSLTLKGATATSVSLGKANWNQGANWDMDGDFIFDGERNGSEQYGEPGRNSTVTMRGAGTTFTMSSDSASGEQMRTVTVESGASVNFVEPDFDGYNAARELVINGDASGSIMSVFSSTGPPANNYFVKVGGSADVDELELKLGVTINATGEYWVSGTHYKEFDYVGASWLGNNAVPRVWTLKLVDGDLRARNIKLGARFSGGSNGSGYFVLDTDNGGIVRDVTADLDMVLGDVWSGVLKANSADVTIGGDLLVNNPSGTTASYITATTATFELGGHLTVANGAESLASGWDMGTSMFVCNGNDNGTDQTLTTKMLPFYDFIINTTGTVTLADNLVLNGDLELLAGAFDPNGNYLIMQGGQNTESTAQLIDLEGMDVGKLHLKAGSETYARLLSDLIVSDNLDIDMGGKLFLDGHTLTAEGTEYISAEWGVIPWDQGEIIGTIPEPGTLLLVALGIGAATLVRRRRRNT